MQDTHDEPPFALPVARPLSDAPPPPPPAAEALYPLVAMTRSQSAVDLAAMVAVLIVGQVLVVCSGLAVLLIEQWPRFGLFWLNTLLGVLSLSAVVAVLVLRRQSAATIGLARTRRMRACVATLIAVPACFVAGAVTNLVYVAASGFDFDAFIEERAEFLANMPDIPLVWILPFSIFVGFHEEILFRGFLLSRLRTLCRSNVAAIAITSAVFGSLHFYQGPAGVFQTAAVGLVLAVVATYARTLWPAIIAHALFDTIGILAAGPLSDMIDELEPMSAAIGLG